MFQEDAQYSPGTPNWVLHSLTSDWYSTHFELMSEALWMHSLYVVGVLTRSCSLVSAKAWIGSKRRMTIKADFITLFFQQRTTPLSRLLWILLLPQPMESSSQQQQAKPWLGWTILVRVVCLSLPQRVDSFSPNWLSALQQLRERVPNKRPTGHYCW